FSAYFLGDLGTTDERDGQAGGLPAATNEAADRAGAKDGNPRGVSQSAATSIRGDALVRYPQVFRWHCRLPENIDGHPAARIPVSADPQPPRFHLAHQSLPDPHRHVLVKATVVPVTTEEELKTFALDDGLGRDVVDDEVREVGLTCHWTQRRELGRR